MRSGSTLPWRSSGNATRAPRCANSSGITNACAKLHIATGKSSGSISRSATPITMKGVTYTAVYAVEIRPRRVSSASSIGRRHHTSASSGSERPGATRSSSNSDSGFAAA